MASSPPQPPVPLAGICSVVYNNVVYTYSSQAFQALSMTHGSLWEQLPMGEPVDGAVCVGSTPTDSSQAGLYLIGGNRAGGDSLSSPSSGCDGTYAGLQKYTYSTRTWNSICPETAVTRDRLNHGAVYLAASNMLLMYAGRQDGVESSSTQTFTIQASAPYGTISYDASAVSPAIQPILLPWSPQQAVFIGGDESNRRVMLFTPSQGWSDSGTTMADPLPARERAAIVPATDGSKAVYTFDMMQSPNVVNRVLLLAAGGKPIVQSPTILPRDFAIAADWPSYNGTLASVQTRPSFAIAQSPDQTAVVIAGGSANEPILVFDPIQNAWLNVAAMLAATSPISVTAASAPAPVLTSSLASSPAASTSIGIKTSAALTSTTLSAKYSTNSPSIPAESLGPFGTADRATATSPFSPTSSLTPTRFSTHSLTPSSIILGASLGAIFVTVMTLGVITFLVCRCRRRKYLDACHTRKISGPSPIEKDELGYGTDSSPAGPNSSFRRHQPQGSESSFSSMAILMGRFPKESGGRMTANDPNGSRRRPSDDSNKTSSSSLFNQELKSTIGRPILDPGARHPALCPMSGLTLPRGERAPSLSPAGLSPQSHENARRSSGWNRWWSDENMADMSKRATVESGRSISSEYSETEDRALPGDPTTIAAHAPPALRALPEFSRVNSGSPTLSHHDRSSLAAKIEDAGDAGDVRPPSQAVSTLSGYSSGIPASVHQSWDPTTALGMTWGSGRAPELPPVPFGTGFHLGRPMGSARPLGPPLPPDDSRTSDMSWLNLGQNAS